jgi:hypothetical protein
MDLLRKSIENLLPTIEEIEEELEKDMRNDIETKESALHALK